MRGAPLMMRSRIEGTLMIAELRHASSCDVSLLFLAVNKDEFAKLVVVVLRVSVVCYLNKQSHVYYILCK